MTEHRAPVVIDQHSHTKLPPEPRAVRLPAPMLQWPSGDVTEAGAILYGLHAFHRRWVDERSDAAYQDYRDAAKAWGDFIYWYAVYEMELAP